MTRLPGGPENATDTCASEDFMEFFDKSDSYKRKKTTIENLLANGDDVTPGTVTASKVVVVDANKDVSAFRNLGLVNLDAGYSGVAGTVDIFPTTASKGKTTITSSDNTGDTTTTINIAAQATTRTLTVPDPGASASFVMTQGTQTLVGVQTLSANPLLPATDAITAFATGGQGSAVALTATTNRITVCATIGDSVKLPTATAGLSSIAVRNDGAAGVAVFPASGDIINTLAANASVLIAPGKEAMFNCAVNGRWSEKAPSDVQAKFTTGTTTTTFAAGQLTGAGNTVYTNTQATPGSIATRTAAQMFADDPTARVGGTYMLRVINGQGTGTLTITAADASVTLTGTATVAINSWRDFVVTYTSAVALVIQNAGTGTFS